MNYNTFDEEKRNALAEEYAMHNENVAAIATKIVAEMDADSAFGYQFVLFGIQYYAKDLAECDFTHVSDDGFDDIHNTMMILDELHNIFTWYLDLDMHEIENEIKMNAIRNIIDTMTAYIEDDETDILREMHGADIMRAIIRNWNGE